MTDEKELLRVYIDPEVKQRLRVEAAQQGASMSKYAALLIEKGLKAK